MSNVPMSLQTPLVAVLAPVSQAAGARSTGWIPAADYFNFMATIQAGVVGGGGTLDAKIEQAQDAAGTGAKDVVGKGIAQIIVSNKTAVINFTHNNIDMTNGFTHVRLTLTVGVAASLTAAQLYGGDARFERSTNTITDQTV